MKIIQTLKLKLITSLLDSDEARQIIASKARVVLEAQTKIEIEAMVDKAVNQFVKKMCGSLAATLTRRN